MKVLTEARLKFEMSKRGEYRRGCDQAIVSHSEENLDTSEMGLLASVAAGKGRRR
jgi:hypothetical protein